MPESSVLEGSGRFLCSDSPKTCLFGFWNPENQEYHQFHSGFLWLWWGNLYFTSSVASGLTEDPDKFGLELWPHSTSNKKNVEDSGNGFIKRQGVLSERERGFW